MEITLTITYPELGRIDGDQADALIDALQARLAEFGPVLSFDTADDTMTVLTSFAVEPPELVRFPAEPFNHIASGVIEALEAAGLPSPHAQRAALEPALS